jgi:hypothetical protein
METRELTEEEGALPVVDLTALPFRWADAVMRSADVSWLVSTAGHVATYCAFGRGVRLVVLAPTPF